MAAGLNARKGARRKPASGWRPGPAKDAGKEIGLLCVDLQNDFASERGLFYRPRSSVGFLTGTLFPYAEKHHLRIAEIVSDYRQPRPGDDRDCCRPGEWGYESLLPDDIRAGRPWVKSMNSPLWTRRNAGMARRRPGPPRPDAEGFERWLGQTLPGVSRVAVFGLTLDRCVLCTAQTLRFFGYEVMVLAEGTDTASGDEREKRRMLAGPPLAYWATTLRWRVLRRTL